MTNLLYADESYAIMGACFEVYNRLGCGFLEPVYQECLTLELEHSQIPFEAQPKLSLAYRGQTLRQTYEPDFICFGKIILELKAVGALMDAHRAQLLNYLHGTGLKLGILINFGSYPKLDYERIALDESHARSR